MMPWILNAFPRWNVFLRLVLCWCVFSYILLWKMLKYKNLLAVMIKCWGCFCWQALLYGDLTEITLFNFIEYIDYFSFLSTFSSKPGGVGFFVFFPKTIKTVFRMKLKFNPESDWTPDEADFCSRVSQGGSALPLPPRRRTHRRSVNYSLSDKNTGLLWWLHNCRVLSADQNVSAAQLFIYFSVHSENLSLICFAGATSAEKPYDPKVRWIGLPGN